MFRSIRSLSLFAAALLSVFLAPVVSHAQDVSYPPLPGYLYGETPGQYIGRLEWEAYYAHPGELHFGELLYGTTRAVTEQDMTDAGTAAMAKLAPLCKESLKDLASEIAFSHEFGAINGTDISYQYMVAALMTAAPTVANTLGGPTDCQSGIGYIADYLVGGGDPARFGSF